MTSLSVQSLSSESQILRNLKGAMFKMLEYPTAECITGLVSMDDYIFLSVANQGLFILRVLNDEFQVMAQLAGTQDCNCYQVSASQTHLLYIMEEENRSTVCVHHMTKLLDQHDTKPTITCRIQHSAPATLHSNLGLVALGGEAWTSSWTAIPAEDSQCQPNIKDIDESHVTVLEIDTLKCISHWKAATNCIAMMRSQTFNDREMLGVIDTRTGLSVYDLKNKNKSEYVCLYRVPVEEIRNFQLVGNFVAVFHKFEPNVSFWNMKEQKTILCINIQDQMKELSEEFLDPEDDFGVVDEDDDHVTSVTNVKLGDDFLLLYTTKSGCIFGMSVANRSKVFNIPCPHADSSVRKNVSGVAFLPSGKLAVGYERCGLTVMDFSPLNLPPRPPTRSQKRPS